MPSASAPNSRDNITRIKNPNTFKSNEKIVIINTDLKNFFILFLLLHSYRYIIFFEVSEYVILENLKVENIIYNFEEKKEVYYTVCHGDTLESIAKQFGVSTQYIVENNAQNIYEGQILYFPETNFLSYVVKPFDTLSKIAVQNSISVESLIKKNNLKNDFVFVGQKLYL